MSEFQRVLNGINQLRLAFQSAGIEHAVVKLQSGADGRRFTRLLTSEYLIVELKPGRGREMYRQVTIQGFIVRWPVQIPTPAEEHF